MDHELIVVLLRTALPYSVQASSESSTTDLDTTAARMLMLGAFGTAGSVHSSEGRADFTSSIFKPNRTRYTRLWSAVVVSIVGVQLPANASARCSATVQLIAHQRYDDAYTPQVGVRSDRIKNIDLKLHSERTRSDVGSLRLLMEPPSSLRPCTTADRFGAAVEFVL